MSHHSYICFAAVLLLVVNYLFEYVEQNMLRRPLPKGQLLHHTQDLSCRDRKTRKEMETMSGKQSNERRAKSK
jgi:hypothetical protein